jgi:hypothetical protein
MAYLVVPTCVSLTCPWGRQFARFLYRHGIAFDTVSRLGYYALSYLPENITSAAMDMNRSFLIATGGASGLRDAAVELITNSYLNGETIDMDAAARLHQKSPGGTCQ